MKIIEFLDLLTKYARGYSPSAKASLERNRHMINVKVINMTQEEIDAVLVDFINSIAAHHGIDYALYSEDLTK